MTSTNGGDSAAPTRVALAGYGLAGRHFHAPLIRATRDARLMRVLTTSRERTAQALADDPRITVHGSLGSLLDGAPELLVIASANAAHAEQALAAIERGIPVLVDKPLAPTVECAAQIVEAGRAADVPVIVFHNRRWDSDLLTLRALIDSGQLGPIHRFESRVQRWQPEPGAGWRDQGGPDDGSGILLDIGPHLVDQATLLFGPATRIYAECRTVRTGTDHDDEVFIALTHAGGTVSHLWASKVAVATEPRMRAFGGAGSWFSNGLDPQEGQLRAGLAPDHPDWGRPDLPGTLIGADGVSQPWSATPGAWQEFYRQAIAHVRGEGPNPVSGEDALSTLSLLELARDSARTGEVRTVPPA